LRKETREKGDVKIGTDKKAGVKKRHVRRGKKRLGNGKEDHLPGRIYRAKIKIK